MEQTQITTWQMHGSTFRLGLPFWFEMYRMARSNWSSLNSSRIWMGSQPAVSGFVLTNIWGKILRKFWSELVVSICVFLAFDCVEFDDFNCFVSVPACSDDPH